MKNGNYKYNRWVVALRIVFCEMKKRRSLKPLQLLWKKQTYGDRLPFMVTTTLPDYISFCRVNDIYIAIPEEALA